MDASSSTTAVSCFGGSNGGADVSPSGGTPGYTYLWSNGATSCRRDPVRFRGSLLPVELRGDKAFKMKVRYIRGNKVVKKYIKVYPGRKFNTVFKFPKKGKWTAVFSYRGKTVSTRVNVNC